MAITYNAGTKTARMTAVSTEIGSAGKLEIGTAGFASILATFTLPATAGTAAGNVLTLGGFPQTVAAAATGTPAEARIRTSADADRVTGLTVGLTSASSVELDSLDITEGQSVTLTSATLTHAPDPA